MLVLSRKVGERIRITCDGRVITLVVAEIQPGKVRVAFEADRDIQIMREELLGPPSDRSPRS